MGRENMIYSPEAVAYLEKHHLGQKALHDRRNVSVIEKANNISMRANNQVTESNIKDKIPMEGIFRCTYLGQGRTNGIGIKSYAKVQNIRFLTWTDTYI